MPLVNIITTTFNHEKFISKCIKSIISQKTNFQYQLIIADDASTDKTPEIIEKFQKKYPSKIKFIRRAKNIGAYENYVSTLSLVNAPYVIVCEGDDYFYDKNKLQIQYDYLEKNPLKSICFHPVKISRTYFSNIFKKEIFPKPKKRFFKQDLNLNDLLKHNFIQTNSALYKWRFQNKDEFFNSFPKNIMPCDYYLHLLHAQVGDIGFIDKAMAVYRIWNGGMWYDSNKNFEKHNLKFGAQQLNFIIEVIKNIATDKKFYLNYNEFFIEKIIEVFKNNNRLSEISQQIDFLKNLSDKND
jgi:glycosyltransferase involved in cell wall biosynthesis